MQAFGICVKHNFLSDTLKKLSCLEFMFGSLHFDIVLEHICTCYVQMSYLRTFKVLELLEMSWPFFMIGVL